MDRTKVVWVLKTVVWAVSLTAGIYIMGVKVSWWSIPGLFFWQLAMNIEESNRKKGK